MKISLNWLREYIQFDFSVEELANRLTMVGLEIEDVWQTEPPFSGIVVGDIIDVAKHPNAEKLKICRVDIGEKVIPIVCGAPNVSNGQRVPVAKIGAVLGEEKPIESVTIRGIQSEGMICSERELGLSDDHSGILILDKTKYITGEVFHENSMGVDTIFEINVTPNRPDCLSHHGIAREIGVIAEREFHRFDDDVNETDHSIKEWISIDILDSEACPRYNARLVYDIKVGSSPLWLKTRLESVGIRAINNIVDITNYVMMETGQPLHGFDYELIQGKKIIVRKAGKEKDFITLDGEKRNLASDDLLICDGERSIALAGIMGGLNTEVSNSTQKILLESAYFNPMTIRKTAKRLGISTEASYRFERFTDPNNTIYAVNRAAILLSKVAEGKVVQDVFDVYPHHIKNWNVPLRLSRISNVLGSKIPKNKVCSILKRLDLKVTEEDDTLKVNVPTFRPDLKREIDLIEEVVRHFGYEKIEPNLHSTVSLNYLQNREHTFVEFVRDILVGIGFLETINNSLVSRENIFLFNLENNPVVIKNPLSPETSFLRTNLISGLLDSVKWNRNRSSNNLRFFEIGKVFSAKNKSLPDEKLLIAGAITGLYKQSPFWGEEDVKVNFYHLKGIVETLFKRLHIKQINFEKGKSDYLKPETTLNICCDNKRIGLLGEVQTTILDKWDIKENVFVFEISMTQLLNVQSQLKKLKPIPKFPSVKRDLAVIVDENVSFESIKELIFKVGGYKLKSIELFDLYKGKQIPRGKKSIAVSLTFLSLERTLKEEEIDPIISSIVSELHLSFSAYLRT